MLARSVYIICDGKGCYAMTGDEDAIDAKGARRIAKTLGYTRTPDGKDYCPKCSRREVSGRG